MQACVWVSWTPHVAGGDGRSPCTHPGADLLGRGGRGSLLLCASSPRALWGLPKLGGLPSLHATQGREGGVCWASPGCSWSWV